MKTIAVIGHIVRDRITHQTGKTVESLGGIANSLASLGAVADSSTKILPVCNIGYDLYNEAKAFFSRFPAIDFSLVNKIDVKNKIHELKYNKDGYRQEFNIGELPMITPRLFKKCNRLDLVLVNYIGGDEFPPRYLKWLKERLAALVYLDYHSLALGRNYKNRSYLYCKRYFRYNPHWYKYVDLADIVQMNHVELESIYPGTINATDSTVKSIKNMHKRGPKVVIITRENKDLVVVSGKKSKPKVNLIPVYPVKKVVDPTGCGDTFAAGFIIRYRKRKDIIQACEYGLYLASRKAGFSGLDGFFDLIR